MVAQEAFLVGIEDGNKRYFRQVQTLTQQVDAHQHIEFAATKIGKDLDTFERGDVGVHVARANTLVK